MKNILVTGAAGLVGSEAMKFFTEEGWNVIGIDANLRSSFFGTPKKVGNFIPVDIRDTKAIEDLFLEYRFDAVIHAAAQPSHDWARDNVLVDFDINARGTLTLLEAVRHFSPECVFVYVSTDKVYGENMIKHGLTDMGKRWHNKFPFKEDLGLDFAGERSLFGCSKTAADIYVQEYGNYFGIKTVCFRPGCITGKNHEGAQQHGFLAYLVKCIKEERPYTIFGFEGKQVRDQIHPHDLVTAFNEFIKDPGVASVYNIGGGPERSVSILEAIEIIEDRTGKKCKYTFAPPRKGDRQWDVHDVKLFRMNYPRWEYKYSLSDIFDEMCV